MARLGGYSGEPPQGEDAFPTFQQLFTQKIAPTIALCPNTLAEGTPKPVGGTPEARKNKRAARALLDQGWSYVLRLA
jgi:hypothetical protein